MVWQLRADHEQKQELGDVTSTQGLDATRPITEALQLRSAFSVGGLRGSLAGVPPQGPGDHVGWAGANQSLTPPPSAHVQPCIPLARRDRDDVGGLAPRRE